MCNEVTYIAWKYDSSDQIKKMFDDKIRTYASANSGDTYSHLQIQRDTPTIE